MAIRCFKAANTEIGRGESHPLMYGSSEWHAGSLSTSCILIFDWTYLGIHARGVRHYATPKTAISDTRLAKESSKHFSIPADFLLSLILKSAPLVYHTTPQELLLASLRSASVDVKRASGVREPR